MKLFDFTIIKLTICLVTGIVLSHFFSISLLQASISTSLLFVGLTLAYFISKPFYKPHIWFGLIAILTTISLGVLVSKIHNQKNNKSHYTHSKYFQNDSISYLTLKIKEQLKPNIYNDKYEVEILKIDTLKASGLALLNIKKDSVSKVFQVDNVLIVPAKFYPLKNPLNPSQFNYKAFLENKNIYSQLYTNNKSILVLSTVKNTLWGFADAISNTINNKLKTYAFKPDELAIINALLLGEKKDISPRIYNHYKKAGAVHILAISGLHVGIILMFLNILFKPIEYLKHGNYIKIILLILCLWSFAIIAGLSASVSRAATMFTFVSIGMNLKRPINTLNTLASSAFVLLLIKPSFLFDVGFQLSYLAVIAIVTLHPIFYKIWKPKYKIVDIFWQAFIISIVAQFGILPISLFYFHQFPGLFFLANVVVIPFLGIILSYGLILIGLALLNLLPDFIALFYGNMIRWMNAFFKWIAEQEAFFFKHISFSFLEVIASYLFIITMFHFYKSKSYRTLVLVLASIITFQGVQIYSKRQYETMNRHIIFHKNKQTLIGIQNGEALKLHHHIHPFNSETDYIISNFITDNHISNIKEDSIQPIYKINKKLLLVIDSLGIYKVKHFKADYILLRNSPKINLKRVIDSLNPELIIADGSNYKSYIKHWKETCKKEKLPFHITREKGAYIFD